jgi:hypothetical protein
MRQSWACLCARTIIYHPSGNSSYRSPILLILMVRYSSSQCFALRVFKSYRNNRSTLDGHEMSYGGQKCILYVILLYAYVIASRSWCRNLVGHRRTVFSNPKKTKQEFDLTQDDQACHTFPTSPWTDDVSIDLWFDFIPIRSMSVSDACCCLFLKPKRPSYFQSNTSVARVGPPHTPLGSPW